MRYGILFLIAAALLWAALPATDTFTGTNGDPLSANWTGAGFAIYTNGVIANSPSAWAMAYWNADAFPDAQYAQLTLVSRTGGTCSPAVRVQASGVSGYAFYASNSQRYIAKWVGGVRTVLSPVAGAPANGDVLRLEVNGNVLTPYRNGVVDTEVGTVEDSQFSSGSAGLLGYGADGAISDNFEAGALSAPPATRKRRMVIVQ